MCIAAAIAGAAVVGAVGSNMAADKAASAQKDATNAAISQQQAALNQQAELSKPYRSLGEAAIPKLQDLLGLGSGDPTKALRETPGYQFAKEQGLQSTVNQASAMGLGLSGNTLQGLDKFSTGLADQTYQQAVANDMGVVQLGQAAAAGQAANIGAAANNISNAQLGLGNSLAGIEANQVAGITKSIGNAANQYMMYNTLQGLNSPTGYDYGGYDPTYNPYGAGSAGTTTNFEDPGLGLTTYYGG